MLLTTLSDPKIVNSVRDINERFHLLSKDLYDLWKTTMFLKWHWWLNLALTVVPWIVWFIVRKKESTDRLLYAGFFLMLITSFYDFIGMTFKLWGYNYKLIPVIPPFLPWDISCLPVTAMLFYQFKPNINPFIKGIVFAFLGAYIAEPLFYWLGLYDPMSWKHYYSLPILYTIYLEGQYFVSRKKFAGLKSSEI